MSGELHVRLDLKYKLNGESLDHLKALAENGIEYLLGNGMLTSYTGAEITEWRCYVSPPRDKHVAIMRDGDGFVAFGVFDGKEQATKACAGLDVVIVKLNATTPQMKLLIQEDLSQAAP